MTSQVILEALAPCGLSCEKCFAHVNSEIRQYSRQLKEKLGNFEIYAKHFETLVGDPIFKKYPDFKAMLDYLASADCLGCRNENCKLFKSCGVRACHQRKQIDYCYACDEFPCDHTGFDEHLLQRWIKINERIRQMVIEVYYAQTHKQPRYV